MQAADAVVVGSGPNGLAAAITLARAGVSVLVLEAEATIGGGARSAELTLPGFVHDLCSAIHPFAYASPFFRTLPLEKFGLRWLHSPAPLAHPFDDGSAAVVQQSLELTCAQLPEDGDAYGALLAPACKAWEAILSAEWSGKLLPRILAAGRTSFNGLRSATGFARRHFRRAATQAIFAGMAAHSALPLEKRGTAGIALALLTVAHVGGWPFPRGGAQRIADSLSAYLRTLGGHVETNCRVRDLRELLSFGAVLLDLTPRQVLAVAEPLLPSTYASLLHRYRYGMAAFKMDWALSSPVPWRSAELKAAATIHLGGTLEEIAAAERAPWAGAVSDRPFMIVAQPSTFDSSRAPEGKHTLWAYCHVPHASEIDMADRMEAQIERFAPGFRDCILARSIMPPRALEMHNANLVGGDFSGGVQDLCQSVSRPTFRYWRTPLRNLYICSASTPPGPGVHGLCGHLAARAALRRSFGISVRKRRSG